MPTNPFDDIADNDHTDELPVLVETVALGSTTGASDGENVEDTAERTAKFPGSTGGSTTEIESLQTDLAARGAKIAALEEDITRLSARWNEIERHLTSRDTQIAELNRTLDELRHILAERHVAEQRSATELSRRDADMERLAAENTALRASVETANANLAALTARPTASIVLTADADTNLVATLRQEVANLSAYIANRNDWWRELKALTATSAERINALQRELKELATAHQDSGALAARESARAATLRSELVATTRVVEELRRELATVRATPIDSKTAPATTPVETAPPTPLAAAINGQQTSHATGAPPTLASIEQNVAGAHQLLTAAASDLMPAAAFEGLASAEAEIAHKRQQIGAQLVELRHREQRLEASVLTIEQLNQDVTELRSELEQRRSDIARLERTVVEKDRAVDARNQRIATLQEELNQRLGAIQKLNAMDVSLQGLNSKMSDRLRRAEPAGDAANVPTLVCLTGDAPKQLSLTEKQITIGRGNHCDIQIVTHFVSREHARLTTDRGTVTIEDLASTNGVFVNSIRVDRHELRHGDLVTIGETQFRFLESMAH